ncbi:MAG TPA: hypothetical protein VII29_05640 [Terriglobales bacterium]|jgi:hypothetical protein
MRGHEVVADIAIGSEELVGAKSHSRLHRQEQSSLIGSNLDHSAAIRDTEFTSTIIFLTSYPRMARDRDSTARSFLVEQS